MHGPPSFFNQNFKLWDEIPIKMKAFLHKGGEEYEKIFFQDLKNHQVINNYQH